MNDTIRSWRKKVGRHVVPAFICLLLIIFQLADFSGIALPRERVDGLLYDLKVLHFPAWPDSVTNVQIVDIDEFSLKQVGRMPWSRKTFSQLNDELKRSGAIVIVYDVLFSEPQSNAALDVLASLPVALTPEQQQAISAQFDVDGYFVRSMSGIDTILPVLLHREQNPITHAPLTSGNLPDRAHTKALGECPNTLRTYFSYAGVSETVFSGITGAGFINSFEDPDGFVRRGALLSCINDRWVPALALEAARVYSLADRFEPQWEVYNAKRYLTGITVGNNLIPTDGRGQILIPYQGPARTYSYTSAADILAGNIRPLQFDQAVVFVGSSAAGLGDLQATPVGLGFPGVEIQATLFDALLNPASIPALPEWWREAMLIQLLLIGIASMLMMTNRAPVFTLFTAICFIAMVVALNSFLWFSWHITLPLFIPVLLTILLAVYYVAVGFIRENHQRRRVKAIFDQYVPPAHIDRLLSREQIPNLDGEKKTLSVLFSDVRSFTSISEQMSAESLKQWLNAFFSPVTQAILAHDGTIDKYVGDMVMAFWGAPLEEPRHAEKAIRGAFAMLTALQRVNETFAENGQPVASIGVGINTGEMNVGDMGSDFRRSYTVIGDAVNLGSRLEGLTKFYGVSILVSEFTKQSAEAFDYLLVDKVKVKGKQRPVTVYTPLPDTASALTRQHTTTLNSAMSAYFARDFDTAKKTLDTLPIDTEYNTLVALYLARVSHFLAHPPPQDWDGSYTHEHK